MSCCVLCLCKPFSNRCGTTMSHIFGTVIQYVFILFDYWFLYAKVSLPVTWKLQNFLVHRETMSSPTTVHDTEGLGCQLQYGWQIHPLWRWPTMCYWWWKVSAGMAKQFFLLPVHWKWVWVRTVWKMIICSNQVTSCIHSFVFTCT